ncbi:DeoR/GlpR family DNA-binding transcription regulator [Chryseobacterium sp. JUb7]|uniref:DeoR/GlpR family DNA-binding transcription regulator n=1 Tax=Chryseobacterium sp. JUb7 TaxID=2940599 RepID=UPI0021678FC5|nr:DeoR/GlpR family DNA-binding transcription regulator [Chryseobacterium sp. JUb7]MCS3528930.1 DeoR/GlpR family transcriptional regulator of sugar metabolism [Chryseobacterium sp. JUb7]
MLKEERFEIILKHLEEKSKVKFEELAFILKVSEDTIRRDIDLLHRNGLLSKVRGGAIQREKDPLSFQDRQSFSAKEKDIIALKTQPFIKDGMTIFMDGGTTICAVASCMPLDIKLRIITNNYSLIPVMTRFQNVELVMLGGTYHHDLAVTTGITTCQEVSKYIADLFIMGTCAVDVHFGISATSISDGETKKAMSESSKKIIALASENKLRRAESFKVCTIENIDTLITDLAANNPELESFRNIGVQII